MYIEKQLISIHIPTGYVRRKFGDTTTELAQGLGNHTKNGTIQSRVIYPGLPTMGPPYGKRDPYYSHIFRDSYGNSMGPKGSHVLGEGGGRAPHFFTNITVDASEIRRIQQRTR